MLPTLIPETLIHPFNFYFSGSIQAGMRHGNEMYKLVQTFDLDCQVRVYDAACALVEQGAEVAVTKSRQRYAIWISLRSPSHLILNPSSPTTSDLFGTRLTQTELAA